MKNESIFLICLAAAALIFAAVNLILDRKRKGRACHTIGTVISFSTVSPERVQSKNSKWATVSYRAGGKRYTSRRRIQVPMTARIGSPVKVCYDRERPEILYTASLSRFAAAAAVAALCLAAAFLL